MATHTSPNGHPPKTPNLDGSPNNTNKSVTNSPNSPQQKRNNNNKRRPNYSQLHSKALPVSTYPLPAFHPTNPISLLRLAYTYIYQVFSPPSSHPAQLYVGYFSPETRSIHVTDPLHIRALWESGFFGKGTLSRSEPSWMDREKAKLQVKRKGGGTAEEATIARREERRQFKLERARAEREKIERQRMVEEGRLDPSVTEDDQKEGNSNVMESAQDESEPLLGHANMNGSPEDPTNSTTTKSDLDGRVSDAEVAGADVKKDSLVRNLSALEIAQEDLDDGGEPDFENQEHLQLTMEEAFFLSYGLGVLDVRSLPAGDGYKSSSSTKQIYTTSELLELFASHGAFPPQPYDRTFAPDDQFLLNYVTYHHFRSLGWVVRAGVKFSVDYLLYQRGPVFSHAEFALIIIPAYSDPYWTTAEGQARRRVKKEKDWWWLHCINRVQSAVLKTLVLVYVDVPPPMREFDGDIGQLLGSYKVREFALKRWVMNRSRD